MRRALPLVLVLFAAACGTQQPGRVGLIGDLQVGYGWEFWRAPHGKGLYLHPKWPAHTDSGGMYIPCSDAVALSGRTVIAVPDAGPLASGSAAPYRTTYRSDKALWASFGATPDEARRELADPRPAPKPSWVKHYETCVTHKGHG